jgi:heme/copper-type cytochrome/quinol oxidase subunit 4
MDPEKKKFEGYQLYIITFITLSALTLISVGLTQVRFSSFLLTGMILSIALIQVIVVLFYNMQLKFHDKILILFAGIIFSLIFLTIIITMLDFANR